MRHQLSSICYGVKRLYLRLQSPKDAYHGANPDNTVSSSFPYDIKGQKSGSQRRLTFLVQQRLFLPALLDPINRHKARQGLKSTSMSVDMHLKNTWLGEHTRIPSVSKL